LTAQRHDLTIRPIAGPEELDLFTRLPYVLNAELAGDLGDGHRRPGWLWVTLHGDRIIARVAFWGPPGDTVPQLLDVFDIDDDFTCPQCGDIGARLLRTAITEVIPAGNDPPEYTRFVPPDWRDHPASRQLVEARMRAAEQAGARLFVERLRLEWRAGTPVPAPTGRLLFRRADDQGELVGLMTQVMAGTLDAHGREDLTRLSPRRAAVKQYDSELARYTSPREWWRIAALPDGDPVGFVIPAHNGYNPIIAYVGVLPAHRANGYIDEILAEGTRILAALDIPRIRASTDVGNVPMASAFLRAGWVVFEREIKMTWR